jgi:hypothetical protein
MLINKQFLSLQLDDPSREDEEGHRGSGRRR